MGDNRTELSDEGLEDLFGDQPFVPSGTDKWHRIRSNLLCYRAQNVTTTESFESPCRRSSTAGNFAIGSWQYPGILSEMWNGSFNVGRRNFTRNMLHMLIRNNFYVQCKLIRNSDITSFTCKLSTFLSDRHLSKHELSMASKLEFHHKELQNTFNEKQSVCE